MNIAYWMHATDIAADWFMTVLMILCCFGHLAVLRTPDIEESGFRESIRRIKIAGFSILSLRFAYVLFMAGDLNIPPPSVLGLTLICIAECFKLAYLLFPHAMDRSH